MADDAQDSGYPATGIDKATKQPRPGQTYDADERTGRSYHDSSPTQMEKESQKRYQELSAADKARLDLQRLIVSIASNQEAVLDDDMGKDPDGHRKNWEMLKKYIIDGGDISDWRKADEDAVKKVGSRVRDIHWCGVFAVWVLRKAGVKVSWVWGRGIQGLKRITDPKEIPPHFSDGRPLGIDRGDVIIVKNPWVYDQNGRLVEQKHNHHCVVIDVDPKYGVLCIGKRWLGHESQPPSCCPRPMASLL
jgi:hypothetical protein